MKSSLVIAASISVLLASCASDSGSSESSSTTAARTLSQRMTEENGYRPDDKGNWVPQSNRRSSFETNRSSPYFQGDYAKKNFQADRVSKKSWWGEKEVARPAYTGATDGSRFTKNSNLGAQAAREGSAGHQSMQRYQTAGYGTGAANEAGARRLDMPSDAETDIRRRVSQQPSVIGWQEQRGMSVNQVKSRLGRE